MNKEQVAFVCALIISNSAMAGDGYLGDFTTDAVPTLSAGCSIDKAGFVIVTGQSSDFGEYAKKLETSAMKEGYNAIVGLRFAQAAFPYEQVGESGVYFIAYGTGEHIVCPSSARGGATKN